MQVFGNNLRLSGTDPSALFMVKAAVQELQPAAAAKPAHSQPRQNKAEQRKLIDGAIGELLVLLSQKASHEVLTQKLETLHGHIRSLFVNPASKKMA